jgi:serine/threonine protein kinase
MPEDSPPAHDRHVRKDEPSPTQDHPEEDTNGYLAEDSSEPLAAPPLDDLPAELLNHPTFRVIRELGRGGMGVVYLAEHRVMKKRVAIKLIRASLLEKPGALARYQREIELASKLDHRNVVRAHHAEQLGKVHLLVMEYVEGKNMARVLRRHGKLPVAHACSYARQAALGLQHAHEEAHLVHRDIKPSNLMLTSRGLVKVLDFGLARQPRLVDRAVTVTDAGGRFIGSALYVSPEQAVDAGSADARSDVYSLGCTLYHFLAGRPPFQGESRQALLSHLNEFALPLHEVRPDVHQELSALVARMMAKEPASRVQTAAEVAQLLLPFCRAAGKGAPAGEGSKEHAPVGGETGHDDATGERRSPREKARGPGRRPRLAAPLAAAGVLLALCVALVVAVSLGTGRDDDAPRPGTDDVTRKEEPPSPPPVPAPGKLVLHLDPPYAVVEPREGDAVKPQDRGRIEVELKPNEEHAFLFTAPGHHPHLDVFRLGPGETQEWEITLAPEPAPSSQETRIAPVAATPAPELEVKVNVAGARVSLDSKLAEKPEQTSESSWKVRFRPEAKGQRVVVTVQREGYRTRQATVEVGSQGTLGVTLEQLTGSLRLRVHPLLKALGKGEELTIDGKPCPEGGVGPDGWADFTLPAGPRKVRLAKKGYLPYEFTVEVRPDEVRERRCVMLRDEPPADFYAQGVQGLWTVMADAKNNPIEAVLDMTGEGKELVGLGTWYLRRGKDKPFHRWDTQQRLLQNLGTYALEELAAGHDRNRLFVRTDPPVKPLREDQKEYYLATRSGGDGFALFRRLDPPEKQWDLRRFVSGPPA